MSCAERRSPRRRMHFWLPGSPQHSSGERDPVESYGGLVFLVDLPGFENYHRSVTQKLSLSYILLGISGGDCFGFEQVVLSGLKAGSRILRFPISTALSTHSG